MSATVLVLVRHGATASNLRLPSVLQGRRQDDELAEAGLIQSRAAAEALAAFPIRSVHCSSLKRARQTAAVIAERLRLPLSVEEGLAEADVGVWSGLSWEEIARRWPAEHAAFLADPERHGYLGGENLGEVRTRVLPVVEEIIARRAGQTILLVGHGVANRVLLASWLSLPLRYARRLPSDNGGFHVVDFAGGAARVRTVNQSAHLDGG